MRYSALRSGGRGAATLVLGFVLLISITLNGQRVEADDPWWQPGVGITWQIQLSRPPTAGQIIPNLDAYEIDLFETSPQRIAAIQATGARVICYFSAGTYEDWRPDRKQFPPRAIGNELADWPGERYVDIRRQQIRTIMLKRLDLAADKGCDAVDPDNVDGYRNNSGFPLKARHQLSFNRFLATAAHKRGLAIGLKNDIPQIPRLVRWFDFAVNEECFQYHECNAMKPFIERGKPVLNIEYGPFKQTANKVCPTATRLGFSTLVKQLPLDAARYACPVQPPP